MSLNFTLLTKEQIWGDKALEVIKQYGQQGALTDYTGLLGAAADGKNPEGELICAAVTFSPVHDFHHYNEDVLLDNGMFSDRDTHLCGVAVRPVLPPSETTKIIPSNEKIGKNGIRIVEYGEYPQTLANEEISAKLEEQYQADTLARTGKEYHYGAFHGEELVGPSFTEYEFGGERYVRCSQTVFDFEDRVLSSGEEVKDKPYWVQVNPVEWLVDPSGTWVSKKCLFAGVKSGLLTIAFFERTDMKRYLDKFFAKDIEPSKKQPVSKGHVLPEALSRRNNGR